MADNVYDVWASSCNSKWLTIDSICMFYWKKSMLRSHQYKLRQRKPDNKIISEIIYLFICFRCELLTESIRLNSGFSHSYLLLADACTQNYTFEKSVSCKNSFHFLCWQFYKQNAFTDLLWWDVIKFSTHECEAVKRL